MGAGAAAGTKVLWNQGQGWNSCLKATVSTCADHRGRGVQAPPRAGAVARRRGEFPTTTNTSCATAASRRRLRPPPARVDGAAPPRPRALARLRAPAYPIAYYCAERRPHPCATAPLWRCPLSRIRDRCKGVRTGPCACPVLHGFWRLPCPGLSLTVAFSTVSFGRGERREATRGEGVTVARSPRRGNRHARRSNSKQSERQANE
jgi:hypothetical protein